VADVEAPRSVLILRRLQRCDHCGTTFLPASAKSTTCTICTNEQDLNDEWMAMLEG
jgi:methionyl-tRNA synthetase